MAEYSKLNEWKNTLSYLKTSIQDITEIRTSELIKKAIEIEHPSIVTLIHNSDALNAKVQKEVHSYQALEKQFKQLKVSFSTKANTLHTALQKEIEIETERHKSVMQKQATMKEELAEEMRYTESERHTDEQARLINKWNIMNQWLEIAGEKAKDIPSAIME